MALGGGEFQSIQTYIKLSNYLVLFLVFLFTQYTMSMLFLGWLMFELSVY